MKVCIGIVTHNRAALLPRSVKSALAQDYPDKEVFVLDDASTDETESLRTNYPQVVWHREAHQSGYLNARNEFMRATESQLFVSLDDDAWFVRDDEVSIAVKLMKMHANVAAIAFDILSPGHSEEHVRAEPHPAHMFIGCGHMLRLEAVKAVGYYTPGPAWYGVEEKDLSLRLLDGGWEIMYAPGIHVWHAKTGIARDPFSQHASAVVNDLAFTVRRCPREMLVWHLPGRLLSHLRFAVSHRLVGSYFRGVYKFLRTLPEIVASRKPVSNQTYADFYHRSRLAL